MTLFHERGYDGIGVAELGREIGVNAPSLYAAFGSKLGLFRRAIECYLAKEGGFIGAVLAEAKSPAAALEKLLLRAAEAYSAKAGCRGCLVTDATRNSTDPDARALTQALRCQTRELLIDWLARHGQKQAEPLADGVMVALAGLSAAARDGMAREALRGAAAVLASGLVARIEANDRPGNGDRS